MPGRPNLSFLKIFSVFNSSNEYTNPRLEVMFMSQTQYPKHRLAHSAQKVSLCEWNRADSVQKPSRRNWSEDQPTLTHSRTYTLLPEIKSMTFLPALDDIMSDRRHWNSSLSVAYCRERNKYIFDVFFSWRARIDWSPLKSFVWCASFVWVMLWYFRGGIKEESC